MPKLFRAGIVITLGVLLICTISGCADDAPTEYGEIKLLATTPADGGSISVNGEFQMIFSDSIGGVTVDGMRATIMSDNSASIQIANLGEATPGAKKTVTISWINLDYTFVGTRTISFTLTPAAATKVEVYPAPVSEIDSHRTQFTLRFNQEVVAVTVSGAAATGSGQNWSVWSSNIPLDAGFHDLDIEWKNRDGSTGSQSVGPYHFVHVQHVPPELTGGTVFDGETDVDPAPINVDGFRFAFDEDVAGTIKLTDEAGVDHRWQGSIAGTTATLTPVAGQELANNTTYKIEIDVQDGGGNPLKVTITFVTKPK